MSAFSLLLDYATPLFFLSLSLSTLLLLLPSRHTPSPKGTKDTAVLVLGDVGRSPRMQYHALSLAESSTVRLLGYIDSTPLPALTSHPKIQIYALPPSPQWLTAKSTMTFLILAPLKALHQLFMLLYTLAYILPPTVGTLLVQNPPAIPTLFVAILVSRLRSQKLVVDWHNFGFSILALKLKQHPLVLLSKIYEILLARFVDENLTVTDAMAKVLRSKWRVNPKHIHVLHDRPPAHFQPFTTPEKLAFLERTHEALGLSSTALSRITAGDAKILVSSTSWTADEDFSIFLEALLQYDIAASNRNFLKPGSLPRIIAIITGRGPLRDLYLDKIATLEFQDVELHAVWLEPADYPRLIACADLGVSLHTSSSGVDLPMKVVDLFGVGVPVAAVGFQAVAELVREGVNGTVFEGGEELGEKLIALLDPRSRSLEGLREGARKEGERRWEEEWAAVAKKVLL